MPLVWKFMHNDFFEKKVSSGKETIDLDCFRKGDKAWPNAHSLENECMILKNFELFNFLLFFFFFKPMMMMIFLLKNK